MRSASAIGPQSSWTRRVTRRGVAALELALVVVLLALLVFGLIDCGRAILARHAIASISRESANLVARGTSMTDTLQAALASSGSYDLGTKGYVILTTVERASDGSLVITRQQAAGGQPAASHVGTLGGGLANLPAVGLPAAGKTLFVAEVFLSFATLTPLGALAGTSMPSQLYDVAYFY